ncbi:MAG TPA: DUF4190 domain-containing protein, partial [Candidatus Acidoferrum sp.]|nr:DUF4190 domain-containing protein [Candidatus Acidoferrum sp.]
DQPPSLPPAKTGLSITSLVLGILAIVPCSLFTGIPAIITGHIALNRAKKSPGEFGGKGMAKAGLILGYVSLVLGVLLLPATMLPALAKAKARAQQVQCMNNLKQVALAARTYANVHGNKFPPDFLSMSNELSNPKILFCPTDKGTEKTADWSTFTPANASYKLLLPGADVPAEPAPLLQCPVHENSATSDGAGHMSGRGRRRE